MHVTLTITGTQTGEDNESMTIATRTEGEYFERGNSTYLLYDETDPDDGSVTDEQRMAAHQEMREVGQKLRAVAQQEREILLDQTARSFGVKGEAGKELVETVKQVYQATESWGGFGRGHGGRR